MRIVVLLQRGVAETCQLNWMTPMRQSDEHLAAGAEPKPKQTKSQRDKGVEKPTWGGGGGRGEAASDAREDGRIRGGGGGGGAGAEQVGREGGVGRAAIEWRHQARHRPVPPRPRPHLRAVPAGWCAAAAPSYGCPRTPRLAGRPATELRRERAGNDGAEPRNRSLDDGVSCCLLRVGLAALVRFASPSILWSVGAAGSH
jgi:hypothetical protein